MENVLWEDPTQQGAVGGQSENTDRITTDIPDRNESDTQESSTPSMEDETPATPEIWNLPQQIYFGMSLPPYQITRMIQEEKRLKQLKTQFKHTKVSLCGPNAKRLLKRLNVLYPNMTRLTLKEIGGKTAEIIHDIDPRGIVRLTIENKNSTQMGDQLNILLKHFKDVKHLSLTNCGSPLGD